MKKMMDKAETVLSYGPIKPPMQRRPKKRKSPGKMKKPPSTVLNAREDA